MNAGEPTPDLEFTPRAPPVSRSAFLMLVLGSIGVVYGW
jgi:hypothetical protein